MLVIVGGKGGCGKTTTAVGLGRALARRGERVLLVDADCDTPNLHTVTGAPYRPGIGTLRAGASLSAVIHESAAYPEVDVLPSGTRTGALSPALLDRTRNYPGRVVVDCPAGASSAVTGPIRAADAALVTTTPETESVRDAVKTARMVRSLDAELLGAVVTRARAASDRPGGSLAGACPVLERVPRVDGDALDHPVGRAAYGRLAEALTKRNP